MTAPWGRLTIQFTRDQILARGDPAHLAAPHPRRTPGAGGRGRAARPGRRGVRVLQRPGRLSHAPPPRAGAARAAGPMPGHQPRSRGHTRQLTQLSATGGRSSAPRRARFRGAGRQAVSRAAAREASRGRREARFRSRRVYEGRVLNTVPRGSRTIPTVLRESGRQ